VEGGFADVEPRTSDTRKGMMNGMIGASLEVEGGASAKKLELHRLLNAPP